MKCHKVRSKQEKYFSVMCDVSPWCSGCQEEKKQSVIFWGG